MQNTLSEVNLTVIEDPGPDDTEDLHEGLRAHNFAATGDRTGRSFAVKAYDAEGVLAGGAIASIHWGWCYLALLWVRQDCRGGGLGGRLLQAAERQTLACGVRNLYLDTYSFQALPFYLKHGYTLFGQLENFPPPHTKYFLRKSLG